MNRPYAIRDLPTQFLWRYIEFRSLGPPYEYYLLRIKYNWDRIFCIISENSVVCLISMFKCPFWHPRRLIDPGKEKPVGAIDDQIRNCHWEHILEVIPGQISFWLKSGRILFLRYLIILFGSCAYNMWHIIHMKVIFKVILLVYSLRLIWGNRCG